MRTSNNTATDKTMPIDIRCLKSILHSSNEQVSIPHRHESFEIVLMKAGSGELTIDDSRYDISAGSVYFITPGQIHMLKPDDDAQGYVISFTNEFLCSREDNWDFLYNGGLFYTPQPAFIKMDAGMEAEMYAIISRMMKEYNNIFVLRGEILRGLLKVFLLDLSRHSGRPATVCNKSRNAELVKRFLLLLDKHYASRRMVLDYADELAVTPNYLNEIVKKVSGFPASHHIQQRVALEAKRQATYAVRSMKEVALNLGFEDFAHFSRFFKKTVGMNFTDYKREVRTDLSL